jgi:hypothetical protein
MSKSALTRALASLAYVNGQGLFLLVFLYVNRIAVRIENNIPEASRKTTWWVTCQVHWH